MNRNIVADFSIDGSREPAPHSGNPHAARASSPAKCAWISPYLVQPRRSYAEYVSEKRKQSD